MPDPARLSEDGAAALAAEAMRLGSTGQVIGLGTGQAATAFVRALGRRVAGGLDVRGVPTSEATAAVARQLGVKLVTLDEVDAVDVAVDGADEVDPHADLIKGYGATVDHDVIGLPLVRNDLVVDSRQRPQMCRQYDSNHVASVPSE